MQCWTCDSPTTSRTSQMTRASYRPPTKPAYRWKRKRRSGQPRKRCEVGRHPTRTAQETTAPGNKERKTTHDQVPKKEPRNPDQTIPDYQKRTPGRRKMRPSKEYPARRRRNTGKARKTAGDTADQATGPTTASPSRRYREQPCHRHHGRSQPWKQ